MALSLLNKKADAAPAAAPHWHPNFRNFERLPDTKVVRTTFFINVGGIATAVLLLAFVGWREYQAHVFNGQRVTAEAEIAKNQKQHQEGLRLTKLFTDEDKKFAEAAAFVKMPVEPTALLSLLGTCLPKEIQLEYIDLRPSDPAGARCTLRGLAAGAKDQASGFASAYVETLRTQPRLAEIFDGVKLIAINPDPKSGALLFEIELKFKGAKEAKKS
ncbi:MAG: hypothetical protein KF715_08835 [Candidatus Didemnitutus sp.]|nr:hypothetical protein [Candidatus Didemnitutus sp.]